MASSQCRERSGPVLPPDELSWIAHLCRSPPINLADQLLLNPEDVSEVLEEAKIRLVLNIEWDRKEELFRFRDHNGVVNSRWTRSLLTITCPTALNDPKREPLLLPYFDGSFPNSTIVYSYYYWIRRFAAVCASMSKSTCKDDRTYLRISMVWSPIEGESRRQLEWLAWANSMGIIYGSEQSPSTTN